MAINNLIELLEQLEPSNKVIAYPLGNTTTPKNINYDELKNIAQHNSLLLKGIEGFSKGSVILLHLSDHLDNIIWFWSVLYAGCIPALSTPFTHNAAQRAKHINHLHNLLKDPICLTRKAAVSEFPASSPLRLQTIEGLGAAPESVQNGIAPQIDPNDIAMLMLTSGSTGDSKAVPLRHAQVLTSIAGKASFMPVEKEFSCLNWIGLDHVAGIIEIHLQAMHLGVDQVHVQAVDLITNPLNFLTLIERHRVARTFAPNFFLAKLKREIQAQGHSAKRPDLSSLKFVVSGGEANPVETVDSISDLLVRYGAARNVIVPGFGMTETCAGSIYSTISQDYKNDLEFASVGKCVPGIEMRIALYPEGPIAAAGEAGDLEVRGKIVINEYYNNPTATASSFSSDGWFRTGDRALIDSTGMLNLVGRSKETMTINGVKYVPQELETAIEEANIKGVAPSYVVCFSFRERGAQSETEQICVVYLPTYTIDDDDSRIHALDEIVQVVMLLTSVRPRVLPLGKSLLQKTTLGKLSRTKIRIAYEKDDYKYYKEFNDKVVESYRASHFVHPKNDLEKFLLGEFEEMLDIEGQNALGVETPVFEMGITSVELIKLAHEIGRKMSPPVDIPIIMIMTNPTIRGLGDAIEESAKKKKEYDPVVVLQQKGDKQPLWLFHPGVGEVLVFLNLAKYFTDRPVYALRARGFEPGEEYFGSIEETVSIYHAAIKAKQPEGPYAMAGYSYGSMLAFETAKVLESNKDQVGFMGVFNLPPHIKFRMKQLDWKECLLNLAYFLDLITEERAHQLSSEMKDFDKKQALDHIISISDKARFKELTLTEDAIYNWAGLAYAMQRMAVEYDPSGSIQNMDVFYCTPLIAVSRSRQQWLDTHLKPWAEFARSEPRFHEVDGAHYTMIGPDHVFSFQKKLKAVLKDRDL